MIALLGSVLAASLLGSGHCAGMCGGFVCVVAGDRRRVLAQVAYHGGRLAAYAALGALAGAFGRGLDRTLAGAGIPHAAAMLAGALLVVTGIAGALAFSGLRPAHARPPRWLSGAIGGTLRAVAAWPPAGRGLAIGAVTALLPCGWLWTFVAIAASAGGAVAGALAMSVFWLGTVPALAAVGFAAARALGPLQRRLPLVTATLLITLGVLTLAGKFHPGWAATHAGAGAACHVAR